MGLLRGAFILATCALLCTTKASASDATCLADLEQQMLHHLPHIPEEIQNALKMSESEIAHLKVNKTEFKRYGGMLPVTAANSLSYGIVIPLKSGELVITQTISQSNDEHILFAAERRFEIKGADAVTVIRVNERLVFHKGCLPKSTGRRVTTYSQNNDFYLIKVYDQQLNRAARNLTFKKNNMLVRSVAQIDSEPSSQAIKRVKNAGSVNLKTYVDSEDEMPEYFVTLHDVKDQTVFDPLAGDLAKGFSLEIDFKKSNGDILYSAHAFANEKSNYEFSVVTVNGQVIANSETISREIWLKTALNLLGQGKKQIVNGFTDLNIVGNELKYSVTGPGQPPELFNSAEYFKIDSLTKSNSGWTMTIHASRNAYEILPKSVPWNTSLVSDDPKYLQGSRWIQLGEVDTIAKSIVPKLSGLNRIQAATVIADTIDHLITYDYDELSDSTVELLTTHEILLKKKGVCQHYSSLFLAVSRRLGIPARMVVGYFLYNGEAAAHAWIEVKANETSWWPIDPQNNKPRLQSLNYFPLLEFRGYEAELQSPETAGAFLGKYAVILSQEMTFTKLEN